MAHGSGRGGKAVEKRQSLRFKAKLVKIEETLDLVGPTEAVIRIGKEGCGAE